MTENVVRIADYERRSQNPDAIQRDPTDSALIIILPTIRIERFGIDDEPVDPPSICRRRGF